MKSCFRRRARRRTSPSPPALCRWKVGLTTTKHSLGESRPRCMRCIATHVVEAESCRGLIRSRCATVLFRHRRLDRRFVSWPPVVIKPDTTDARSVGLRGTKLRLDFVPLRASPAKSRWTCVLQRGAMPQATVSVGLRQTTAENSTTSKLTLRVTIYVAFSLT